MNQFWIFLIVVGISVASSIIGKLKEQAEINRAREAARKRREEEERTGRPAEQPSRQTQISAQSEYRTSAQSQQTQQTQTTTPAPTATSREQRMRDIAARRQAELRELRERQARMRAQRGQTAEEDSGAQVRGPAQRGQRTPDVVRPGTPRPAARQTSQQRRSAYGDGETNARDAYLKRDRERQREIAQTREIELEAQRQSREVARKRQLAKDKGEEAYKSYVPLADLTGAAEKVKGKTKAAKKSAMSGSIREMLTGGTAASRRERLQMIVVLNELLDKPLAMRERSDRS